MSKTTKPAAKKASIKRAGLVIFDEYSGTDPKAVDELAGDNSPRARMARILGRAEQWRTRMTPASYKRMEGEIAFAAKFMNRPKFDLATSWALLALERGLDLLETERHLKALIRDEARQRGSVKGGAHLAKSNTSRAKLPPAAELQAEIDRLNAAGEPAAKERIAKKYKATPQAIGQKLKKLKDRLA